MVVADDLAPIWRQDICNRHDDDVMQLLLLGGLQVQRNVVPT